MIPPARTKFSTPLFLAEHIFVCLADNHLVFMDLHQDRYFCLNRQSSLILRSIAAANKSSNYRDTAEISGFTTDNSLIIRALADRGLLASLESKGKPLELTQHRLPAQSLGNPSSMARNAFGWRFVRSFFWACSVTSYELRKTRIERTVRTVGDRRSHRMDTNAVLPLVDLVQIFLFLRPLYPREYLCLFDSLCLVHFLAQFRHFPLWVFGVKLEPFGAHCWVQNEDTVLNDTVEVVRQYTPILVA